MYTLVTKSYNKRAEFERLLGVQVEQFELELPELQAVQVEDVVAYKAEYAFAAAGKRPVMIEDTGLFFDAWNGLPGALIRWFEESVGAAGICRMLAGFPERSALARTIIATYDGQLRLFRGEVAGTIAPEPRGANGFGWDSIFIPAGDTRTFAEMAPAEKDRFSMRRRAVEALKATLR
jgi:non-canonical purine NTP pyrophosphatase (RdgB/HAM1 family)